MQRLNNQRITRKISSALSDLPKLLTPLQIQLSQISKQLISIVHKVRVRSLTTKKRLLQFQLTLAQRQVMEVEVKLHSSLVEGRL
jgi:hypothetical protein